MKIGRAYPLFILLLVCFFSSPVLVPGQMPESSGEIFMPEPDSPALVRVDLLPDPALMTALCRLDLDIAFVGRNGEGIDIVVHDRHELERMQSAGIPWRLVHRDVTAFYQGRNGSRSGRDLGLGSMGGFFTLSEVEARLDAFRADFPNLISAKTSIGQSREGRDIWAVKISDNPDLDENEPEAIIDSLTHAREPQGMMSSLYFVDWVLENYPADPLAAFLVEQREMWVVPVHNPDGYVYNESLAPNGGGMWRKNRRNNGGGSRGVDLNRNWSYKWGYDNIGSSPNSRSETYRGPSAASEPETQALAGFITARGAMERMSIHCYGNMWLIPWCYDNIFTNDDALFREIGNEMAPVGYDLGTSWELLYVVNGGSLDWDYGDQGIITFSPEMGRQTDGFWPELDRIVPIAEKNLASLQYFYAISGSYLLWEDTAFSEISGNGNGYADPGETLEVVIDVMNRGLMDAGTSAVLNLSALSSNVTILSSASQVPALQSRESGSNASQPFQIEIDGAALHGDRLELELEILFDGGRLLFTEAFTVGTPRRVIFDDIETDIGWQVGLPDDTATTGIWERVNPIGTWSGGKAIQPEDDATPGGSICYVTGNAPAGSDPGLNDVDDGKTTLLTPVFDLSGGASPRIGYSRWFGNAAGRSGADDEFLVEISNDSGDTWVELELIAGPTHNEWVDVTFGVDDVITATNAMRIRFVAEDAGNIYPNHSLVEAAIDDFWTEGYSSHPILSLVGDLVPGSDFTINLAWEGAASYRIYASLSLGSGVPYPGGTWYLDGQLYTAAAGTIPIDGIATAGVPLPGYASLIGQTLHFQAYATPQGGGTQMISNVSSRVVVQ